MNGAWSPMPSGKARRAACANAFAAYTVIMKNGMIYKAKAKWTIVNGKAMIALESGQTLQVDGTRGQVRILK